MQFLTETNETLTDVFNHYWELFLHEHQQPPAGDWTTWLLMGGRGAGKTRAGAQWVKALIRREGIKVSPIALIGETEHDAREVMVEGVSGLLAVYERGERPEWIPSRRRLRWRNGAVAQVFSAEDPESLRGPQFGAAWCDELAKWRHGYGNHPSDPGGPTNFGITLADYRRYAKPGATAADVRAMRIDEAKAIYREHYWNAMRCDEVPAGLDYALFDFGVNSGNSRAVKMLQRLLGLPGDGRMTEPTLAAVRKGNAADLIALLCDQRLAFLKGLRTWPVFGAGWGRRVAEVRAVAVTMARTSSEPKDMAPKDMAPKISARHIAIGGIVAAGAGAAQQIFGTGALPASVAAMVLIALAIAGFLAWRWWRQRPDSPITGGHP